MPRLKYIDQCYWLNSSLSNNRHDLILPRDKKFGKFVWINRSSGLEVFCKKSVLKNFAKFTGILLCQRLFFDKLAGLGPSTLFKKYSDTGFFLWLLWNSEEHRFCRTFQWLLPKPLSPSSAKLMSDNLCLTTKRISLYLVPRAMSKIFDFTENNT